MYNNFPLNLEGMRKTMRTSVLLWSV